MKGKRWKVFSEGLCYAGKNYITAKVSGKKNESLLEKKISRNFQKPVRVTRRVKSRRKTKLSRVEDGIFVSGLMLNI